MVGLFRDHTFHQSRSFSTATSYEKRGMLHTISYGDPVGCVGNSSSLLEPCWRVNRILFDDEKSHAIGGQFN
jgi:hypothetical protein